MGTSRRRVVIAVAVVLGLLAVGALVVATPPAPPDPPEYERTVLAISPDGGRLYMTRPARDAVVTVDLATGREVASVRTSDEPTDALISADGRRLYVADFYAGTVTAVDTTTNAVIGAAIPVGPRPRALTLSPDGSRLAVGTTPDQPDVTSLSVIDTRTLRVVAGPAPIGPDLFDKATFAPRGDAIYILFDDTVAVVDPATVAVTRRVEITAQRPLSEGWLLGPDGRQMYGSGVDLSGPAAVGFLVAVDTATGALGPPLRLPHPYPTILALSPDGRRLYVSRGQVVVQGGLDPPDSAVLIVDTATMTVTGPPIILPDFPGAAALSSDGARLYLTFRLGGRYGVIDTVNGRFLDLVTT